MYHKLGLEEKRKHSVVLSLNLEKEKTVSSRGNVAGRHFTALYCATVHCGVECTAHYSALYTTEQCSAQCTVVYNVQCTVHYCAL